MASFLVISPLRTRRHLGVGFLAHFLDALFAGDDASGIQVHIVLHALVCIGVAANFDDRHGGEALRRAPAGGEHHELCAGGRHAREDFGLPARGILDPQALAAEGVLGIFENALNGLGAALDDGAQALFFNRGQAAGNVAGGGLALRISQPMALAGSPWR